MNPAHAGADSAVRVVRIAGEVWPATKAYLRLLRAEMDLARESLPALAVCAALTALAVFVMLASVVAGVIASLVHAGWSVPAAVAVLLVPACLVAAATGLLVQRRLRRLTLPQTRRRVRVLLEILDDD